MTRGTSAWRAREWGPHCSVPFDSLTFGGHTLRVHSDTVEAFDALSRTLAHYGYRVNPLYNPVNNPPGDTGVYNCRPIGSTNRWSSHAYATAIDINWLSNAYGTRGVLGQAKWRPMIEAIEAIRTKSGAPVWRRGVRRRCSSRVQRHDRSRQRWWGRPT